MSATIDIKASIRIYCHIVTNSRFDVARIISVVIFRSLHLFINQEIIRFCVVEGAALFKLDLMVFKMMILYMFYWSA